MRFGLFLIAFWLRVEVDFGLVSLSVPAARLSLWAAGVPAQARWEEGLIHEITCHFFCLSELFMLCKMIKSPSFRETWWSDVTAQRRLPHRVRDSQEQHRGTERESDVFGGALFFCFFFSLFKFFFLHMFSAALPL